MILYIWLMRKRGEPRVYTTTVQPSDEQIGWWRQDGFTIYRVQTNIPDLTDVDAAVHGSAVEIIPVEQSGLDQLRELGLVGWSEAPDPPKEE